MGFVLVGVSAHPVWLGLIFSYFFGYKFGLTPITGYCNLVYDPAIDDCGGLEWASHLILPWITFAILYRGPVRAHDPGDRHGDDGRGLRAHGASQGCAVTHRHALARSAQRDAANRHDARHGHRPRSWRRHLHRDRLRPARARANRRGAVDEADLPVVQGIVVFATICVIVFNLVVDILYAFIDPRIRFD